MRISDRRVISVTIARRLPARCHAAECPPSPRRPAERIHAPIGRAILRRSARRQPHRFRVRSCRRGSRHGDNAKHATVTIPCAPVSSMTRRRRASNAARLGKITTGRGKQLISPPPAAFVSAQGRSIGARDARCRLLRREFRGRAARRFSASCRQRAKAMAKQRRYRRTMPHFGHAILLSLLRRDYDADDCKTAGAQYFR